MKVSVIVPTYGKPIFLDRAIKSVLNQSLDGVELIIVDDNNPDTDERKETEEILKKYSGIKYIKHEKNLNGASARNTGIKAATGKYISFLDSDDEYYLDRLEKCYSTLELADDNYAGVFTGCDFFRNGKKYYSYNAGKTGNYIVETLACTFMLCTGSNLFIRKDVIDELNGFDDSFERHQDYEFLVRIFEKYSLISLNEILVIKNNENFNVPNPFKLVDIKEQYLEKYEYIINKLNSKQRKIIYSSQYFQIVQAFIENKDLENTKKYYKKCINKGLFGIKQKVKLLLLIIKYCVLRS